MATNLDVDPALLSLALEVSGAKSKKDAVTMALEEFIARREQQEALRHFGTLEWAAEYDYKQDRRERDDRQ